MKRGLITFALLAPVLFGADASPAPRWRIQYFYDRDDSQFSIHDLGFSSPDRGIAVGVIAHKKVKLQPMSVITRDGGKTWTEVPLKESPRSLFVLNDAAAWIATAQGIWRSDEAGRSWHKISNQKGVFRVFFRDEMRGWASGAPKLFAETQDGGKTWRPVAAAQQPKSDPENSYYDWIAFSPDKRGMVMGASVPQRRERGSWMDPETLALRREVPSLALILESKDDGVTWKPQTAPIFGRLSRFRVSADGLALSLVRFVNSFQWPSEVFAVDPNGVSKRVFREKDRSVTDVGWLTGKTALLAAIEPPGRLHQLPVPGKLHVLRSDDTKKWTEMKVDYKAYGKTAFLSVVSPDAAWIATDGGQILKLQN